MSKALYKGLAALIVLAGLLTGAARAADDTKQQTYVVIVGIDQYKDPQILPRKHAEADAALLYDVFTNPDYLGVDNDHIRLLLGKEDSKRKAQVATKDNILKALNWVVDRAAKDDIVMLVYIGQGAPVGERTCYFTADSNFKDRAKTALAAADIETVLDKLKAQRMCAFVDVNFKGFDAKGDKTVGDPDLTKFYRELLGKDDEGVPLQQRTVFMPNAGMKPSLDLKDHGIFGQVLADGLRGKADNFGYEPDGLITIDELVKFIRHELPELARANGKNDDEKGQQPVILEGHTSDYVLDHNPKITKIANQRIEAFEKVAKTANFPKNVVEEGTNYLKRMPKLEAQQSLRKAYQKLADGKLAADALLKERETILAGTKMSVEDAGTYARTVMSATEIVLHYYYKKVSPPQLIDSAVRGMYRRI